MGPWSGDLEKRALAAYFRFEVEPQQPSESSSGVETHKKKSYVVLRSARGVLAVFRVRTDGVLKRLKRWPSALDK